ncbi:MAG: hypothetical protein QM640_05985 [Niabella sp.]
MNKVNMRTGVIMVMILLAALSRVLPHPYNFSPLVAMALFGGVQFKNKWQAYLMPVGAYLISDLVLQLTGMMGSYSFTQPFVMVAQIFVYAGMILVTALGTSLHNPKVIKLLGYSLTGSAIFWLVSNFGVWAGNHFAAGTSFYEPGLTLGFTYLRALPFYNSFSTELFVNAFAGDLLYVAVLFGAFALIQKNYPAVRYSNG